MLPTHILLALGACLCWATGQTVSKKIIDDTDMEIFRVLATFSGFVMVILYAFLEGGVSFPGLSLILVAVFSGILDPFIGILLYLEAIKRSQVHLVAPLANTAPFWGVLTGFLFLHEGFDPLILVSVLAVISGSYLISGRPGTDFDIEGWSPILALLAGVAWGVTEVGPTKYCLDNGMSLISFVMVFIASSGIVWFILFIVKNIGDRDPEYTDKGILMSLLVGVIAFFGGWTFWMSAIENVNATLVAPTRGSLVLFAFLLSVLFLGERPKKEAILGMILILLGVVLVSLV